jgi:hypothetical protein
MIGTSKNRFSEVPLPFLAPVGGGEHAFFERMNRRKQ